MKTALLIPVLNPGGMQPEILETIRDTDRFSAVVVCAADGCNAHLPDDMPAGTYVMRCGSGEGTGSALKKAFVHIRDNMPQCARVLRVAPDGGYTRRDILQTDDAAIREPDALVLGRRRTNYELALTTRLQGAFVRQMFACASGRTIHDAETGLCAFSRDMIDTYLHVDGDGYEYEVNALLYAVRNNVRIAETLVSAPYTGSVHPYSRHLREWIHVYGCVLKFALSSLMAFLLDLFLLLGMNRLLDGLHEIAALVISVGVARVVSCIANFFVNHFIVFDSNEPVGKAMLKFLGLQAIIMAGNYAVMHVLNIVMNMPLAISKVIADTALFALNFGIQGKFVYNKK